MPSATLFLLFGAVLATVLSLVVLARASRRPRSPLRSVSEFDGAMRALSDRRATRS